MGSIEHGLQLHVLLTRQGQIDPAAYFADPAPWRARRFRPGRPDWQGVVVLVNESNIDAGWALRGETQVKQNAAGLLVANPAFHQGPYGTLALGIHLPFPVGFLGWARIAPFAAHQAGVPAGTRTSWYAFGGEVTAGRLQLKSWTAT